MVPFTFDGNDFLLEAKWQEKPIDLGELYKFGGKDRGEIQIDTWSCYFN